MGIHISYLGRFSVAPALNDSEIEYVNGLAVCGPATEDDDPYRLPAHPAMDLLLRRTSAERAVPAAAAAALPWGYRGGPPRGGGWQTCILGDCLHWGGDMKFSHPGDWLAYLVDHLLGPGAKGRQSSSPDLAGFTFDHEVNGAVAVWSNESSELWLVLARANVVSEVLVSKGELALGFSPFFARHPVLDPLDPNSFASGRVPQRPVSSDTFAAGQTPVSGPS